MKKHFIIPLFLTLISCSPALYNVSFSKDTVPAGLLTDKEILVLTPADAVTNESIVVGSGAQLANKIFTYLNTKNCEVTLDGAQNIKKIDEEELLKYDYIIVPTIINWEDNATAWSGKPDKLTFTIEIFDKHKNSILSSTLDAKSTNATFSANDPSELIDKPLINFVSRLF